MAMFPKNPGGSQENPGKKPFEIEGETLRAYLSLYNPPRNPRRLPEGLQRPQEASWSLLKIPWASQGPPEDLLGPPGGLQGPFKIQKKSNLSEGKPLIAHLEHYC